MKKILALFSCVFLLALVCLNACSADYNTFDASDYCTLSELHFEEESSNPSVYQAEHKIIVTLEELPDSMETWDSVTVSDIDMSSLAKLYLVESKFSEFPTDSSELDSLAKKVAISDKAIKEKSKIRIPKSQTVYVVIISESGKRAIWQLKFEIPGVVPEESSSSIADGESSSSTEKENSETSLELKFENSLEVITKGDSILVEFPQGTDLSSIKLESSEIPEGAKVEFVLGTNPQVDSVSGSNIEIYLSLYRYFLDLHEEEGQWVFEAPEGYDGTKYLEFWDNEEYFKTLYEEAFEEALGTEYYKEGTPIDLKKWTLPAKDLRTNSTIQLYFLAENIGKTDYDKEIYTDYMDYLDKNSFDEIEVHNQDIKVYVYWNYTI